MMRFLKFSWLYALISIVVISAGLYTAVRYGFTYSIDFVGGTDIEYQIDKKISSGDIKAVFVEQGMPPSTLRLENNILSVRLKPINEKQEISLRRELEAKFQTPVKSLRFETVGPVIGKETIRKTFIASLLAILGILIYMSIAFKDIFFAVAAIAAMVHDFFVVVGVYSLFSHFFGAEIDTMFVTAVLTTMSFSVHDTIVIFDKIREYFGYDMSGDIEYYANKAITETMVRSINNSMTIIFMLLALTLMGGSSIRFFVAALLVGTITGTYSSPFIATPILVWLEKRKSRK
ncbi:MAG: protein translocase subunit SecF [Patescibacteria group bacterium]